MGIDFCIARHEHVDGASWSYSGFNAMREWLARQELGIELRQMEGFGGSIKWDSIEQPDHPLIPFLDHSDCDGRLTGEECEAIAPALRAAVERCPKDIERAHDLPKLLKLAAAMQECAEDGCDLLFR